MLTVIREWLQLVAKLLCAVIKKLATPDEAVRNKSLELLNLLSTRIKAVLTVKLPALNILDTFKHASNDLVRNTCLMYLSQALDRLDSKAMIDMVRPSASLRGTLLECGCYWLS
jgi:hypothetical protein